jgi:hypothetical protein
MLVPGLIGSKYALLGALSIVDIIDTLLIDLCRYLDLKIVG